VEELKTNIEKFNRWIRKNTLFAVSVPIVLLLLAFFISSTISSMNGHNNVNTDSQGYNNKLPNQTTGLEVQNPVEIYNKAQLDSINAAKGKGVLNSIKSKENENDSLQKVLDELDAFTFPEEKSITEGFKKEDKGQTKTQKSEIEDKLAYRKLLLDARQERLSKSQDYSAPFIESSNTSDNPKFIKAAIHRDQFVLPDDRVNLILREDTFLGGRIFPKNTFVFATCNIQGSRVLLKVSNIEKMGVDLEAYDFEDGMSGLYNERAGDLITEFKINLEEEGIDYLANEISEISEKPLARNVAKKFGNFFSKKRYRQNDKILLIDGTPIFLKGN
jgi:hypothetical protein